MVNPRLPVYGRGPRGLELLAMKTELWLLNLILSLFLHHYKTIVPCGSFPVGHVIQAGDFTRGDFWSSDAMDLATDPRQVVGHTVLKPFYGGRNVRLSDVSP